MVGVVVELIINFLFWWTTTFLFQKILKKLKNKMKIGDALIIFTKIFLDKCESLTCLRQQFTYEEI